MKVLVNGAGGQLGKEMIRVFSQAGVEVTGLTREEWDITDSRATDHWLSACRPDVLIHCAAYTNVDESEFYPLRANRVNADASKKVAKACGERGVRMVYISTDYVFDGRKGKPYTEEDEPNPINHYGRSKRLGEMAVARFCPRHLILRTSWLYGTEGHNFVRTILRKAREGENLRVVDDQVGSPTFTVHLAEKTLELLQTDAIGVYHVANTGSCSWFAFARAIVEMAGMNVDIEPISSEEIQRPALRPAYSVLTSIRLAKPLPNWREGLKAFIAREGED